MTNARVSLFIALTWFAPATAQDIVAAMRNDLATVKPAVQPYTRWLWVGNEPEKGRAITADVISGHCNGTSREVDLAKPVLASELLRINLADYGWDAALWDSFAETDPWFHVKIETLKDVVKTWPAGIRWTDGKTYSQPFTYWDKEAVKVQTVAAPWLATDPTAYAAVCAATQAKAPIYRADWFFNQTAIQDGRKIGYYGLQGIKDEKSFQRLVRFNAETAKTLEQLRVVVFSDILRDGATRRIEVVPTVMGGLWRTRESVEATDKKDPLTILDDELEFEATEQFAAAPNGMIRWFLGNRKGESQTKAPDNLVQGDRTGHRDSRLHVGLSCLRCHFQAKHEQGIKDIDDIKIGRLKAYDYAKFIELKRKYLRSVEPIIKTDRERYAAAIMAATGMDSQEYALAYQAYWSRYEDARVDAARAAQDWRMSKEAMLKGLRDYDATTENLAPLLTIIMNGGSIPIRQWESVQPVFHLTMKGLSQ